MATNMFTGVFDQGSNCVDFLRCPLRGVLNCLQHIEDPCLPVLLTGYISQQPVVILSIEQNVAFMSNQCRFFDILGARVKIIYLNWFFRHMRTWKIQW